MIKGGFRGGGRTPPPLRGSTRCRPKWSAFLPTDHAIFLKAPPCALGELGKSIWSNQKKRTFLLTKELLNRNISLCILYCEYQHLYE